VDGIFQKNETFFARRCHRPFSNQPAWAKAHPIHERLPAVKYPYLFVHFFFVFE